MLGWVSVALPAFRERRLLSDVVPRFHSPFIPVTGLHTLVRILRHTSKHTLCPLGCVQSLCRLLRHEMNTVQNRQFSCGMLPPHSSRQCFRDRRVSGQCHSVRTPKDSRRRATRQDRDRSVLHLQSRSRTGVSAQGSADSQHTSTRSMLFMRIACKPKVISNKHQSKQRRKGRLKATSQQFRQMKPSKTELTIQSRAIS